MATTSFIILEGPDGSGKTTLAERLVELYGGEVWHRGPIKTTPRLEYIVHGMPDHLVVADRWHIGEMIYGPLYRGRSMITADDMYFISQFLHRVNAYKVLCIPENYDDGWQRMRSRGDLLVESRSQYATIWHEYRRRERMFNLVVDPIATPNTAEHIGNLLNLKETA